MNSLKPYFTFTAGQRNGVFALLILIAVLQAAIFAVKNVPVEESQAKRQWLALQSDVDALKKQQKTYRAKIYPFNPNFITDFKGYRLGMSVQQIDRLLEFRKGGRYVNSAEEFQSVTGVGDSLLSSIAPYFKFPDWVKNSRLKYRSGPRGNSFNFAHSNRLTKPIAKTDINSATQDDLIAVYGIGPALSERILKQREILGGFVSMEQMGDVWGLSPEVIEKLDERFKVASLPEVKKVAINDAPMEVLSQFPYFRYPLSKDIVTYRSMAGRIKGIEDLKNVKNFPVDKIAIIAVYLEF